MVLGQIECEGPYLSISSCSDVRFCDERLVTVSVEVNGRTTFRVNLYNLCTLEYYVVNLCIYINIILFNDSDLFKFLLIHSLFLSYFAELKFPVQCTDDS